MLNTTKLLYILPELALVVELLPGKKPNDFSIQSFRQINGEFIDENQFVASNVTKLFEKLEEGEFHLILPDYLFTNTIVSVKETDDKKIAEYLQETLLPQIALSTATHDIDTTVLTTFKKQAKVQLSAMEKTVLAPIRVGASDSKVTISAVSPLSWTIKSLVSLEPSVTVLQVGTHLYSALHYIGVDQANQALTQDADQIAETIKTLKGVEANLQTLYLLTDTLTESRLKELLNGILPIQQLANDQASSDQLPGYLKQIIETAAKTLAITDYPVPKFSCGEASDQDRELVNHPPQADVEDQEAEELNSDLEKTDQADKAEDSSTHKTMPGDVMTVHSKKIELKSVDETQAEPQASTPVVETAPATVVPTPAETPSQPEVAPSTDTTGVVDLAAVENPNLGALMPETTSPVIKNQSGAGNLVKLLLITLSVFVAVVAIGVGVGLGWLSLSNKDTVDQVIQPEVEVVPTQTDEVEPTPTPELTEIDLSTLDLLVVNATTKAGYAGTIKQALDKAGVKSATAGNAKGSYESEAEGLVLTAEEDQALVVSLSEAAGLKLEYAEGYATEDTAAKYSAVIVLTK